MPLGLESGPWLTLALGAFVLGHLVVLAYFLRASAGRSGSAVGPPPTEPSPGANGDGPMASTGDGPSPGRSPRADSDELPPVDSERVVNCPHCGVRNAAEYQFCRFCVGDLSDGATLADSAEASRDGQAF